MCKETVLDNRAILKILGTSQLQMQRALLPKRKAKSRRLGVRLRRLSGCETKARLTPAMVAGFWVKIQTYESNGTFRAKTRRSHGSGLASKKTPRGGWAYGGLWLR